MTLTSLIRGFGFGSLLLLVGCATLEVEFPEAKTPKQALLVAEATLETTNNTIASLYCPDPPECVLGSITKAQAVELRSHTKEAATLLNAADTAILAGTSQTATSYIAAANAILLQLKKTLLLHSQVKKE